MAGKGVVKHPMCGEQPFAVDPVPSFDAVEKTVGVKLEPVLETVELLLRTTSGAEVQRRATVAQDRLEVVVELEARLRSVHLFFKNNVAASKVRPCEAIT
ncbi:hypothetical protein D3C87_1858130 [compost metagenome]